MTETHMGVNYFIQVRNAPPIPPVADYAPCPECGHPLAYQDQFRGCQTIVELRCKEREPNVMCGCISSLEVMDGR